MNLPNKLTLTRIVLVPVFMIFVSLTSLDAVANGTFQPLYYLLAGIVFAAASFTDFLDGHLARKWNMVTDFGKFADPLADKLLTTVAFIYMMRDGVCSPVVLCIILAREFAVSGLRMVAAGAKDGKVIAANMWGKVKTVLQMLSIIFYFSARHCAGTARWKASRWWCWCPSCCAGWWPSSRPCPASSTCGTTVALSTLQNKNVENPLPPPAKAGRGEGFFVY